MLVRMGGSCWREVTIRDLTNTYHAIAAAPGDFTAVSLEDSDPKSFPALTLSLLSEYIIA